ncbi:unnamed protein product [Polarella glacialis]|uniref:CHK kinase-like domain-containing protein n=1 Tax=Polarella glacialis TaxID=89957 RepID=A0A813IZY4_POLGL|nr:unnamed protein product [Polarella glacialis]
MAGPLLAALEAKDGELLRLSLAKVLKVEILGHVRLEQSAGQRFTGGSSTPVWKITFSAKRGEQEKETRLVAKWVKPVTDLRRRSYANERQFYLSAAGQIRKFCRVPHMLLCEEGPSSSMCFLFDDLTVDFPLHPETLDVDAARGSLRWLAHFHACFWEADSAGGSFPSGMLSSSDYWGLSKGDNEERLKGVAGALLASSKVLKAQGVWEMVKSMGLRLATAARPLDSALRTLKGFVRNRTLLHGDFKAANFFLRKSPGNESEYEAAVVDFEFAGPGLVAVDLANFLFPDLRMNLLSVESDLIRFYHSALTERLEELGSGGDFPLWLLLAQFAVARCDYMRYMLGKGWTACSDGDVRLIEAVHQDLSRLDGGQILTSEGYEVAIAASFMEATR